MDAHFTQIAEGFRIIRSLRRLIAIADHAPSYTAGAWDEDEDCWEPEENTGPYERAEDAIAEAWANPASARILRAWGHRPRPVMGCCGLCGPDGLDISYREALRRLPR